MAGTVTTHRTSFAVYSTPLCLYIRSRAVFFRYSKDFAKISRASMGFPFRAHSTVSLVSVPYKKIKSVQLLVWNRSIEFINNFFTSLLFSTEKYLILSKLLASMKFINKYMKYPNERNWKRKEIKRNEMSQWELIFYLIILISLSIGNQSNRRTEAFNTEDECTIS